MFRHVYIFFLIDLNVFLGGRLAQSYASLLEEIWVDDKSHASTWELKKIIAKLAPQVNSFYTLLNLTLISLCISHKLEKIHPLIKFLT